MRVLEKRLATLERAVPSSSENGETVTIVFGDGTPVTVWNISTDGRATVAAAREKGTWGVEAKLIDASMPADVLSR